MTIQYEWSGHFQLYVDCPLDCLTFPSTCADSSVSTFSPRYISFLLVVRAAAPFVSQAERPPGQGGVGSCNHQHRWDEVFGVEGTIVACSPLGHRIPAYLLKGCTLH